MGNEAVSFAYNHDARGRITSITDLAVTGQNRSFTYDGLGRLTTATGPWGSGSYTYDALNNLTTRTLGSRVVEMEYNASNRLHRHRDTGDGHVWRNYAYDSRGNVTNNGTIGFSYDRAERPVSISGGASGSFTYDAHGRRVKQVVGGQTIYSVYSASGTLLYRDNATTGAATDYIRMGGRAIARVRGSDVEWTYADHLGSPAAAASAAGAILWREDHTPYGEARQAPAANADNEGFTGHIADAASGLVYMQARYYDPVVGRFLSSDPVGFATGGPAYFNRYAYTANDPVNAIDPTGMWIEDLVIGVPSAAWGAWSAVSNAIQGNWVDAGVDAAGVAIDIAAIATPGVPGGAGFGIQATRRAGQALDAAGDARNVANAADARRGADFITNADGVTMSTNRNYDLVDTQTPTKSGGDWLQIHNTHSHGGAAPHTHRPGSANSGPDGQVNRSRETSPTSGADMSDADRRLRDGELRERANRRDHGG